MGLSGSGPRRLVHGANYEGACVRIGGGCAVTHCSLKTVRVSQRRWVLMGNSTQGVVCLKKNKKIWCV